jgi:hypothetical protein
MGRAGGIRRAVGGPRAIGNDQERACPQGSWIASLLILATLVVLMSFPSFATAAETNARVGSFGSGDLALGEHSGVAINQTSSDIYIADSGNGRVAEFGSDGTFIRGFGTLSTPTFIAVDNSGVSSEGSVYVFESGANAIAKFAADGTPVSSWGSGGRIEGLGEVAGVVVDSNGVLYVLSTGLEVRRFAADGEPLPAIEGPRFTAPIGAAIDSEDNIYKATGALDVAKFSNTGAELSFSLDSREDAAGLGIDPANNDLFVIQANSGAPFVYRFEVNCGEGCTPVEGFGGNQGELVSPQGIAIRGATGAIYVTDSTSNEVALFEPRKVPSATTGAATTPDANAAVFTGEVNPNGAAQESCFFEYGPSSSYGSMAPCEAPDAGEIGSGEAPVPVHAAVENLSTGTIHFRIVSKGDGVVVQGADQTVAVFGAPTIVSESVEGGVYEATLRAAIDPGNRPTTYFFEYGEAASYGSQTAPVTIPSGGSPVTVSTVVATLTPGNSYHFRVAARNEVGSTLGPDQAFATLFQPPAEACGNEEARAEASSLQLPACRAYERVTPAFKNGGVFQNVMLSSASELLTTSYGSFYGTENTSTAGSPYLLSRHSAWDSRPLALPARTFQATQQVGLTPFAGVGGAALQIGRTAAEPSDAANFVYSTPLGSAEFGPAAPEQSLQGLLGVEVPEINESQYLSFKGSTPAVSTVVYAVKSPADGSSHSYLWPFDSTQPGEHQSLYQYPGLAGHPILVGVTGEAGSTELVSDCGTELGALAGNATYNAISTDGSTVFFSAAGENVTPGCTHGPSETELYARIDGDGSSAHTVPISEPSAADCSACDTSSPSAAIYQGASESGEKAFFITSQELLSGNPGETLYEYNFAGPPGEKVTAIAHRAGGAFSGFQGVVRISEDGSHVYFVASEVLTGAPNGVGSEAEAGGNNLYAYDTSTQGLKFVATLPVADEALWSRSDARRPVQATPDGQFLLFSSNGDLTPDDTSTVAQLFRYDASTGSLIRISVGQNGYNSDGNTNTAPVTVPARFAAFAVSNGIPQKMISDDGSTIAFESSSALTPGALDNVTVQGSAVLAPNIYEWNEGHVGLLTDGRDRSANNGGRQGFREPLTQLVGMDGAGVNVYFITGSPLVSSDTDTVGDIYDARRGGGIANPQANACQGEGCQGGQIPQPQVPTPASAGISGEGNVSPPKRHPPKHHQKRRERQKRKSKHKNRGGKHRHGKSGNSKGDPR